MSKTLRLVYLCDHIMRHKGIVTKDIVVTRQSMTDIDVIDIPEGAVDIEKVFHGSFVYHKGYHYRLHSKRTIQWLNPAIAPSAGQEYNITVRTEYNAGLSFDPEHCIRCNGNGWYTGIFSPDGDILSAEDGEKLIQDVLQTLLTDKSINGVNGTLLPSITGQAIDDAASIGSDVISAVKDAQAQIKKKQTEIVTSGGVLNPSEILDSLAVSDIEVRPDDGKVLFSVIVRTGNGEEAGMTLAL